MSTPQTRLCAPASAASGNAGVLLAGAGISGIGGGYRLKTRLPGKTFPGVRSDPDLPTFACQFKRCTRDNGLCWINGQATGFGHDGDGDGWVPAYEYFALAMSGLCRHQIRRSWSPVRRARTEGTAGD
jgi:hypothetical protein